MSLCPADTSLLVLERFWNDGSPSGFGVNLEGAQDPRSPRLGYPLPLLRVPSPLVTRHGDWSFTGGPLPPADGTFEFPLHPAMASRLLALYSEHQLSPPPLSSGPIAVPMASARTVALLEPSGAVSRHLKLHYPGTIGRFPRDLSLFKWSASLDRSERVKQALVDRGLGLLLPEVGGALVELPINDRGFGYIVRSARPIPVGDAVTQRLVPAFAIWARPPVGEERILTALARTRQITPQELAIQMATGVVRLYFDMALRTGLMPELNAQNLGFVIGDADGTITPCIRDMQDVFVDAAQAPSQLDARLGDYKTLNQESADLTERRSFSYDFKLGMYVLEPLGRAASGDGTLSDVFLDSVRGTARECVTDHATYFGPPDQWFRYGLEAIVGRTSYERVQEVPRFR